MTNPKITITDVARKAGVSISTVSRVLNDNVPVSDELRAKVLAAVADVNYRPKVFAHHLQSWNKTIIGLVLPGLTSPFFLEVFKGIERECFAQSYVPYLFSSEEDPEKEIFYTDHLLQMGVSGIIYIGAFGWEYEDHLIKACERGIPITVINREVTNCLADHVLNNKTRGNYLATNHLIRLGHRRIGCVATLSYGGTGHEQLKGYHQAMEEAQAPIQEDLIIETSPSVEGGYQAGKSLLQRDSPPTAIFVRSDVVAIGVMGAAFDLGFRIPEDISIVGFGDISFSSYLNPPLTTIHQPQREMGAVAARLLFERIENKKLPQRQILIEPNLVVRGSTTEYSG
jgi:LacI family transcriptional regulator